MIKVAHLITSLGLGGSERQLVSILKNMNKDQFENIVICVQNKGVFGEEIESLGIRLYVLNMSNIVSAVVGVCKLIKILKKEKPAILQTWLHHADFFGFLANKWAKVPKLIWNIRCSYIGMQYYSWSTACIIRASAFFSKRPEAIIVNSQRGLETHQTLGYTPRRWHYIPNGFNTEAFTPNAQAYESVRKILSVRPQDILIGIVGRYDRFKNHTIFLEAAGRLYQKHKNVKFLMVGLGTDPSNVVLSAASKRLGIFEQTYFLGPRRDIADIMAALDIFVLTSISEGFPNVLCEAMLSGVPCISTDVGDARQIVGDAGIIVPPQNVEALSAAIAEIVGLDKPVRQQMGLAGRSKIVENYSISKIAQTYERFYQTLCVD